MGGWGWVGAQCAGARLPLGAESLVDARGVRVERPEVLGARLHAEYCRDRDREHAQALRQDVGAQVAPTGNQKETEEYRHVQVL